MDALLLLAQRDPPIDLVLLDSTMPRMSGLEVLAELRRSDATRALPVIFVTGLGDVADRVSGLQAGANDYIVKPVHLDELVARVRATLRGQAAWANALEVELRERAEVAATLAQLRLESTPEATASSICSELARLRDLPLVALISFGPGRKATMLAVEGGPDAPFRPGAPVRAAMAESLRRNAESGPWVDMDPLLEDPTAAGALDAVGIDGTMNAPLRSHGDLIGLLLVGIRATDRANLREELDRRLPSVIDFAAIASALVGPALQARSADRDARAVLEEIITKRKFTPVFQPVFNLESGKIVGYEALTRFDDGVGPEKRFAEAVREGLGIALESACLQASVTAARALEPGTWLSLNVSPALVLEGAALRAFVDQADRPILVELTEHEPVDDYDRLRAALERLGDGARVSVDDAGSGYASLRHILALRPAFVKLDATWVAGLDRDPARQALVAGLMHFAASTGCELIAEGVETVEERAALDHLAVKLGQGYLLGRPQALS